LNTPIKFCAMIGAFLVITRSYVPQANTNHQTDNSDEFYHKMELNIQENLDAENVIREFEFEQQSQKKFREMIKFWRQYQFQQDLTCLTDNIYSEAGFEPDEGKVAVAIVTLNRLKDPSYPKTLCDVVYERHRDVKKNKIICQFSWTCKPIRRRAKHAYQQAIEIARKVLLKQQNVDGFDGVTLYHAAYVHPDWADKADMVTQIGQHIFYR